MNTLSPELLSQLFSQESPDPFLTLLTLSHPAFSSDVRLVNNTVDIVSRGDTYMAFPFKIRLPVDDGETARDIALDLDNASLELIEEVRAVTTAIGVKFEMVLASMPDVVQISQPGLKLQNLSYTGTRITARVILDNFLDVAMPSERYEPTNFPGIF